MRYELKQAAQNNSVQEKRIVEKISSNSQQHTNNVHFKGRGGENEKLHSSRNDNQSVQDRLGNRPSDRSLDRPTDRPLDRPLDREELESRRPQVKAWEVNPEYVPKKGYYFEHDNREDGPGFRSSQMRGRGRGRFTNYQPYRGKKLLCFQLECRPIQFEG